MHLFRAALRLPRQLRFAFSQDITTMDQVPKEYFNVTEKEQELNGNRVSVAKTIGTFSILDKVPGVKSSSSPDLLLIMFTCTKCDTRNIRTFTKHAYNKGVVMSRCDGCHNVHLIADNLKWFSDEPINVETMHPGTSKIQDPAAVLQFLNKAFGEDQIPKVLQQQETSQDTSKDTTQDNFKGTDKDTSKDDLTNKEN